MAIAFVQSDYNEGNGSSTTIAQAFGSNVTAGNLLVACLCRDGGGNTVSVTDSQGNTWQRDEQLDSTQHIEIWSTIAGSTGANTVTATFSSGQANRRLAIHEYSGVTTSSWKDVSANNHNSSTSTPTSTAVTPNQDNSLFVGALTPTTVAVFTAPGAGSGFTEREEGPSDGFQSQDFIQGTAASKASTWSLDTADPANCLVVVYKPLTATVYTVDASDGFYFDEPEEQRGTDKVAQDPLYMSDVVTASYLPGPVSEEFPVVLHVAFTT